jgi:hypothetical protein
MRVRVVHCYRVGASRVAAGKTISKYTVLAPRHLLRHLLLSLPLSLAPLHTVNATDSIRLGVMHLQVGLALLNAAHPDSPGCLLDESLYLLAASLRLFLVMATVTTKERDELVRDVGDAFFCCLPCTALFAVQARFWVLALIPMSRCAIKCCCADSNG